MPGFRSIGEMRYIWRRGIDENWKCSCGSSFYECDFWAKIRSNIFKAKPSTIGSGLGYLSELHFLDKSWTGKAMRFKNRRLMKTLCSETVKNTYAIAYRAVNKALNCRVIVDSSKIPSMVPIVDSITDEFDIYLLHVVREPGAVVYSESFRKRQQVAGSGAGLTMNLPFGMSLTRWSSINAASLKLADQYRYLRTTYESLTKNPAVELKRIFDFVGEDDVIIDQNSKRFPTGDLHMFSGNPSRIAGKYVELKFDDEWKQSLPPIPKMVVEGYTLRQRKRYGYA